MDHFYQNIGEDWFGHSNFYTEIVDRFPSGSHFVEVGSWKGRSSVYMAVEIINSKKDIKFDCVDIWEYTDLQKDIPEYLYENLYDNFIKNIQPVKDFINPIKLFSSEASKLYEDNSLDFVFIDAAHDYENVRKDIQSWLPKVKFGGIISGHDYDTSTDGVKKAVDEYFGQKNIINKENCWIYEKKISSMKNYKVIDTFIFGGELEMLKMRLDYLYDSVDYFVISESKKTHNGKNKELTYLKNKDLFKEYENKIKYVIYDYDETKLNLVPNHNDIFASDLWKTERGQRDSLKEKVLELSDENTMILHSDCDEIPNKNVFDDLWLMVKDLNMEVVSLEQPTYYYSPLNLLELQWFGSVAFNHQTLINLSNYFSVRENRFLSKHIYNAGYHFSFFLTPEQIKNKLQSYAHQEFNNVENTDINNIKKRIYSGEDVLGRSDVKIIKLDKISDEFPTEFYRHKIFFDNIFDRRYLKPQMVRRKNGSMQIPLEIENLQLEVSKHNPKVIVEIGSANGGTLARWLEIPSVETIISIDLPIGIHGGQGFEERTYVISDCLEQANLSNIEFYAINGNSKDPYIINRLEELLNGRKIDFFFIDGDHTYLGAKTDFDLYESYLSKNALVGFHDIIDSDYHREHNCYVSRVWNELKNTYNNNEYIYTNHLDRNLLPHFYEHSKNKGGFGGIGVIKYAKKIVNDLKFSLIVPIYNNVDDTINNVTITLNSSTLVDQVILFSNGTTEEGNEKLLKFSQSNPIIELHINKERLGFIKAVNESIKLCKNEFMICLNSDAHMYHDWENRLIPLCLNKNNGLVGPVMVRDFILGSCFVMKKSIMNKIGLLNEGFGLGYEDDVELSQRVVRNGYQLGYCCSKPDFDWDPNIEFPLNHVATQSFSTISPTIIKELVDINKPKNEKLISSDRVTVLKNMSYGLVLNFIRNNIDDVILCVNESGEEFEKIRYDDEIIKIAHILECTKDMNMDEIISSMCKGKKINFINDKKLSLTWLAKFDDHSSMGILSQRILENLNNVDLSCKEIIGVSETKNKFIKDLLLLPKNHDLGIMFSYPDMIGQLDEFRTKVIYTGVDSTGGIPNFATNCNKADFLLTPSNISKKRMEDLGVTKPIFVFPHGIEKDRFKFKKRKKDNIFKFLYVGECSERKGTFHLVNAFIQLFGDNPNVELILRSNDAMVFYGGDKLKELISPYSNIHWDHTNTTHDELSKLYDECHVYVYPSRADTFGMTLLEVMSSGLPIISTNDPGVTELIEGRYDLVHSDLVEIENHPWMLGKWGNPSFNGLKSKMIWLYENYDTLDWNELENHSKYVNDELNWEILTQKFQSEILPKLKKEIKILTLLTSYERPNHIPNVIESFKQIREEGISNHIYIVENSESNRKEEIVNIINSKIDENFTLYVSEFNMGQRGSLLQVLDMVNIDDYDFVQFSDQDNIFKEPLSTYCDILLENQDITFVTGYMSKEHGELGWRKTRFGNLCEKRSLRAGHMFMRIKDLKSLFPIHLDSQYNQPWNSSWYAGLDWELTYWNNNSIGKKTDKNFVLCVPGGVLHKGTDSTFYEWNVEENEYTIAELSSMR